MTDQPTQPEAPCDLLTGCHLGLGHKGRCEPIPAPDAATAHEAAPEVPIPIRTEQEARITRNARALLVKALEDPTPISETDPGIEAAGRAALRAQIMDLDVELEDYYDSLAPEADDDALAADDTPQTPTTPATAADEADDESGDVVDAEVVEDEDPPADDDRGIPGVHRPRALPATLTDGLTVWTDQCSAQVRQTVYPLLDTNDEPLHNNDGTPASIGGEGALFLALDAAPRADEAGNPYRLDAGTARDLRDLLNVATARGLL